MPLSASMPLRQFIFISSSIFMLSIILLLFSSCLILLLFDFRCRHLFFCHAIFAIFHATLSLDYAAMFLRCRRASPRFFRLFSAVSFRHILPLSSMFCCLCFDAYTRLTAMIFLRRCCALFYFWCRHYIIRRWCCHRFAAPLIIFIFYFRRHAYLRAILSCAAAAMLSPLMPLPYTLARFLHFAYWCWLPLIISLMPLLFYFAILFIIIRHFITLIRLCWYFLSFFHFFRFRLLRRHYAYALPRFARCAIRATPCRCYACARNRCRAPADAAIALRARALLICAQEMRRYVFACRYCRHIAGALPLTQLIYDDDFATLLHCLRHAFTRRRHNIHTLLRTASQTITPRCRYASLAAACRFEVTEWFSLRWFSLIDYARFSMLTLHLRLFSPLCLRDAAHALFRLPAPLF